jgi:hypothetical protein
LPRHPEFDRAPHLWGDAEEHTRFRAPNLLKIVNAASAGDTTPPVFFSQGVMNRPDIKI